MPHFSKARSSRPEVFCKKGVLENFANHRWFLVNFAKFSRTLFLTLCSCHVTYAFQSESTIYSCLDVKELLARSRCEIWSLSETLNHLAQTLNHLAKLVWPNGWMFVYKLSGSGFESSCNTFFHRAPPVAASEKIKADAVLRRCL